MFAFRRIGLIFLITRICLTSGILSSNTSPDSSKPKSLSSDSSSYLLASIKQPSSKYSQHRSYSKHLYNNGFESVVSPGGFVILKGQLHPSHLHSNASPTARVTASSEDKDKLRDVETSITRRGNSKSNTERQANGDQCDFPWSSVDCHPPDETSMEKASSALKTSTVKPYLNEHRSQAPRRSSYRITEDFHDYLPDDADYQRFHGYPGSLHPQADSKNVAAAVQILDNFLGRALNDDSYNTQLHPPTNPLLALVLSKYGRYVPSLRNPRVYSYMAVNNIHNNKPFGRYKLECDDDPTSSTTR